MSRISDYVYKIQNQTPINLNEFKKTLISKGLHLYVNPPDINAIKSVKDKHVIAISDFLRSELEKLILIPGASRAEAAGSFQSHNVKVNGSLIVAKHRDEHPYVVLIDKDGNANCNSRSSLLIVENRGSFLSIDDTFDALDIPVDKDDLVIALGNGNEISNVLHTKYLQSFSNIYYFLDIDLGGLRIARSVKQLCTTNSNHVFLTPPALLASMGKMSTLGKLSEAEKKNIYKLGSSEPFLLGACNLLLALKHKAEQEFL